MTGVLCGAVLAVLVLLLRRRVARRRRAAADLETGAPHPSYLVAWARDPLSGARDRMEF